MKRFILGICSLMAINVGIAQTNLSIVADPSVQKGRPDWESNADLKRKAQFSQAMTRAIHPLRAGTSQQHPVIRISKVKSDDADPAQTGIVLSVADDCQKGSNGYQMWLDADANTYGSLIPAGEWDARLCTGNMSDELYSAFEYTIPAGATGSVSGAKVITKGASGRITVPPGTYDFCIVYPDDNKFRNGFWYAGGDFRRQDNYVFEGGYTYTFYLTGAGEVEPAPPFDIAMDQLKLPANGVLNSSESISIRIKNRGTQTASSFKAAYRINGSKEITETVSSPLRAGETQLFTFAGKADLSVPGLYEVTAWVDWEKDQYIRNDTLRAYVKHPATHDLPFNECFDHASSIPERWNIVDANADGSTWEWQNYPGSDEQNGYVCYANGWETSETADDYLISDPIALPERDMHLTYDIRSDYIESEDAIEILYGTSDNPAEMAVLDRIDGIKSDRWNKKVVNFDVPRAGNYHFAFHAISPKLNSSTLELDEISLDTGRYVGIPDLETVRIKAPFSSCDLQNPQQIDIVLANIGNEAINAFSLDLKIDSEEPFHQEFSRYIGAGDTVTVTLYPYPAPDFSEKKKYAIECRATCNGDVNESNNIAYASVINYIPVETLPFNSRFDHQEAADDWYPASNEPGRWGTSWVYDADYTTFENYEDSVPLVSRCIRLEPGSYRVKLNYSAGFSFMGIDTKENFVMMYGLSDTDPLAWDVFMDRKDQLGKELTTEETFEVTETGYYSLGIMATRWNDLDMGLLSVYSIDLEKIPEHDLRVTAFGSETATLRIPAKQLKGMHRFDMTVLNRGLSVEKQVKAEVKKGESVLATTPALTTLERDTPTPLTAEITLPTVKAGTEVTLRATASAGNDGAIISKEALYTFAATDSIFGRDKAADYEKGLGANSPISFGNVFTLVLPDTLTSVSVGFAPIERELPVGISVFALGENGQLARQIVERFERTRPAEAGMQTFAFPPRILPAGSYYFVITQLGNDNIAVARDSQVEEGVVYATSGGVLTTLKGYGNIAVRANFGQNARMTARDMSTLRITRPEKRGVFSAREPVSALVANNGYEVLERVVVRCSVNGRETAPVTVDRMEPYSTRQVDFTADLSETGRYDLRVWTTLEGDMNPDNDVATLSVECKTPDSPYVMNFEDCTDFAISDFSPAWKSIDADGEATGMFQGYTFPHNGEPMGFIVFNPKKTTPSMEYLENLQPHGGERFGACFTTVSRKNNDMLMSPKLKLGTGSTLEMYVKTYSGEYMPEKYQVLVSTTDEELASFEVVGKEIRIAPTEEWSKVTVDLGSYDRKEVYLAIRCISEEGFVFMIDDIEVKTTSSVGNPANGPGIRIYPNPVGKGRTLTVESDSGPIRQIRVNDASGQTVYSETIPGETRLVSVQTAGLCAGVYFVRIETRENTKTATFVVTG